jgi:hypothetical protein
VNYRYPEGYRLPKGGWLGHKTKVWKQIWIKDGLTEETEEAKKLGIGSLGFQLGQIVDEKTVCHLLLQVKFMPISVKST